VLPIADEHRRRNQSTSDRWETMAPHRARVMRLIADARGDFGKSLCVLGAGNANDIDLIQLAECFGRITLVDLDAQSLARAVERLPKEANHVITPCGGIDLTGILSVVVALPTRQTPSDTVVTAALHAARTARRPVIGTFDVVVSTCLLSQLIDSVCMAVPADHPQRHDLIMAVRNRHLDMMVEMLEPSGKGVLVTDFVSTETAPELARLDDAQVPAAAIDWINRRNFFTGTNPYAIRDALRRPSDSGVVLADVQVSPAWRWDIGAKQLAVSAVTFRRRK
jgi:hypothetical protein